MGIFENLEVFMEFSEIDKFYDFSIDKLTVLGTLKCKEYYFNLIDFAYSYPIPFFEKVIDTQFFTKSWKITNFGFLQIDITTLKFRLEFNPNKITSQLQKKLLNVLLSYIKDVHFSRIDLAIDLYNYNLYDYNIVDLNARKKAYYYDRTGKLETCYFGSMSSNKFIRIYNKGVEQKVKDKNFNIDVDWWRVELQLRDTYIDTYLTGFKDFLDGILIFKYYSVENLSFSDKACLDYILKDMSRLGLLSKNARTRYKRIINELKLESLSFINDLMQHSYVYTISYLKTLAPTLYNDDDNL